MRPYLSCDALSLNKLTKPGNGRDQGVVPCFRLVSHTQRGMVPVGFRGLTHAGQHFAQFNLSRFVARKIWRRRGVSPHRGRAHRLQRRAPLRGLLMPLATTFALQQTAREGCVIGTSF